MSKRSRSANVTRRDFVKGTTVAGVGFWAGTTVAEESKSPNEKINFACVGIGGKGGSDSGDAKRHGNVVAICDVDKNRLGGAKNKFKGAKAFTDYRKMLDEKNIDAVTVSTPDHTHAPAAMKAMLQGMHCFVQKPLTHTVSEARLLADTAREKKLVTQMGNQGTAGNGLREAAALIKAGVLGTIKEVHVWTNRPVWAQGGPRPKASAAPAHLDWNQWLGAAPERPYAKGYHPFSWRGWWDFGTGALGDMACHTFNMPFMACDLANPTSIEAETAPNNKDSYPKFSVIKFQFPKTDKRPAIPVTWYDGGKRPSKELFGGRNPPGAGALIIGEKGTMHGKGDYCGGYEFIGDAPEKPKVEYPRSPGHFTEWANAIKNPSGPKPMSNFADYAGPLTETILLGNLAVWAGKKVEWDAKNLKATNAPEVEKIIRKEYRKGFGLG